MALYAGGRAYGDIRTIPTSAVDNIAARLYNEHKQEQADRKRSADLLDQEFGKNMSKMKDVDIPEFVSKYEKFKQGKMGLLKKGNKATVYDSLEVQKLLADAQSHLAGSIRDKNEEEEAAKLVYKNPNGFKLEAPAFLAARRNTPRSQYVKKGIDPATGKERVVDMSDLMGNIIDDGAGTDFTKLNKAALGTAPIVRGASTLEETPLTKTTTTYKAYNPPSQYIDIVNNGVKSTREKSHYVLQNQKSDEEAAQIIDAYGKLRQMPEFKNAYPNEPEIPATMLLTPFGKTVALRAMEDAITNPPIAVKGKPEQKLEAVMDRKDATWLKHNNIVQQQHLARIRLNNEGRIYEIDNVPLKLKQQAITLPSFFGNTNEQGVDVTNWSDAELDDVLGKEKNKYGIRDNKPYEIEGKKYLKITPNGFQFQDKLGNPITVDDKEIIVNTDKRTRGLEKPVGTGKAVVRDATPKVKTTTKSGLPVFH